MIPLQSLINSSFLNILRHLRSKPQFTYSYHYKIMQPKDLNDDLLPTLMGRVMAETKVSHDRPVTANMTSREHYLQHGVRIVDWTL